MHFELLKSLNTYLFTVNDLMTCIAGINKLNYIMLKDITSEFNFDPNGDYYTIAITRKRLKQFIESGTGVQHLKDKKTIDYSKDLIGMIDKVIDFGLFIRAGTELEQKAVNHLLLVDKDIRDGYEIIRDEIANSSRDDMREFKLIDHKKSVVDFIFKLNERIKKYS